ncbi:MAG: hypothetical protein R3Y68_09455 [Rikenellaceae bacterium]
MSRFLRQPKVRVSISGLSFKCATSNGAESIPTDEPTTEESTDGVVAWAVDTDYLEGQIVSYDGTDYRVMQDHTSSEVYPPNAEGVAALYMVYRGADLHEWIANEYIEQGWQRTYEGSTYECIAATAVANIYSPDVATSVWSKI